MSGSATGACGSCATRSTWAPGVASPRGREARCSVITETRSLSDTEIEFYKTEGYLILRGVFEPREVDALAADVDRVGRERSDLIDANNLRVRFKQHHESG